ncbi:MAG: ACP S-malonyltransferase [Candidatus Competibacteraceae bacterium]|nr:ACP S-malonyltransferase [Candidatus Competibacteraceae bacterium]
MKALIFPGQGSQFPGMGKMLYENSNQARKFFDQSNEILGFRITDVMFDGTEDELRQTNVTQPAIFIHSVVQAMVAELHADMMAGHSLGEFSALVAAGALRFEDGLQLVAQRANAMQKACEMHPSTMAAVLGLDDEVVERICASVPDVVVPANYNCPGQLVISGSHDGVTRACELLKEAGAKRAILLSVAGAFHSPLMEPAQQDLSMAIHQTPFHHPRSPVYQNINAMPFTDPDLIKQNLIDQLTGPVRWTQTIRNMIADGANEFIEVGPGKVLQGLVKKINQSVQAESFA